MTPQSVLLRINVMMLLKDLAQARAEIALSK